MLTITLRYRFLIWLLLIISPTPIIVDQFLRAQQDIAIESDAFERQLHCIYRNIMAAELYRRAVNDDDSVVHIDGMCYRIEPAHEGAVWLRPVNVTSDGP
jgi:hypothetical protein